MTKARHVAQAVEETVEAAMHPTNATQKDEATAESSVVSKVLLLLVMCFSGVEAPVVWMPLYTDARTLSFHTYPYCACATSRPRRR